MYKRYISWMDDLFGEERLPSPQGTWVFSVPEYPKVSLLSAHILGPKKTSLEVIRQFIGNLPDQSVEGQYLNLISSNKTERSSFERKLGKVGYGLERVHSVCVFQKQRSLHLPPGFSFSVGSFKNEKLFKEHSRLLSKSFPGGGGYAEKNRVLARRTNRKTYLVNVQSEKGLTVGTGSILIGSRVGMLFSGCVLPKFQKKGVWTAVTGMRQALASTHGVESTMLYSSNEIIVRAADMNFDFLHFSKCR